MTGCWPQAEAAGAAVVAAPKTQPWGGYTGYFADPDGFRWEIAYNPTWTVDDGGTRHRLTSCPDGCRRQNSASTGSMSSGELLRTFPTAVPTESTRQPAATSFTPDADQVHQAGGVVHLRVDPGRHRVPAHGQGDAVVERGELCRKSCAPHLPAANPPS